MAIIGIMEVPGCAMPAMASGEITTIMIRGTHYIRILEPPEHHHADALVHPGLDKGGCKHEASHNEPGGIRPVQAGHLMTVHDTGRKRHYAHTERNHRKRYRFRQKAPHNKQDDSDGHFHMEARFQRRFLFPFLQIRKC